jgi:dTDP-L-rhamnose 4-epimerase
MANAICRGFGRTVPPPIVTRDFRVGDVRHITASPERARATFGFTATIKAEDGFPAFGTAPLRYSLHR